MYLLYYLFIVFFSIKAKIKKFNEKEHDVYIEILEEVEEEHIERKGAIYFSTYSMYCFREKLFNKTSNSFG